MTDFHDELADLPDLELEPQPGEIGDAQVRLALSTWIAGEVEFPLPEERLKQFLAERFSCDATLLAAVKLNAHLSITQVYNVVEEAVVRYYGYFDRHDPRLSEESSVFWLLTRLHWWT